MPTVAAHKGLSTTLGYSSPFASPADVGPGRARAPRRALPRVPLGLRGRRRRGPVRPGDRRPGRQPARREHAGRGHRTEPERVRRARHDVVVAARPTRGGRAPARQAARPRGRGQRAVGHRRGVLRLAAGPDPGVPGVPDHASSSRSSSATPRSPTTIKRKVLGLNALRLHDVDPVTVPCAFTRADLEQLRLALPARVAAPRPADQPPSCRASSARERAEHGV